MSLIKQHRAAIAFKREARAVPSAFVGEGAALGQAKEISAATGMASCRVGSCSQSI